MHPARGHCTELWLVTLRWQVIEYLLLDSTEDLLSEILEDVEWQPNTHQHAIKNVAS